MIPFFQKAGVPTLPKQKMAEAVEKLFANLRIFWKKSILREIQKKKQRKELMNLN